MSKLSAGCLACGKQARTIIPQLIAAMQMCRDRIDVRLNANALGGPEGLRWEWSIPFPPSKPFREAKLRIDQDSNAKPLDTGLIALLSDALLARELVLASPELSINQIAKREGRCRKQLTKLVRLSWLSPNIVEAIVAGSVAGRFSRKQLFDTDLSLTWSDQEQLLGFAG